MKFEEAVVKLFEFSEDLRSMRDELVSVADTMANGVERIHIICAIKEIDIIRVMLLGQYELLDTSRIVQVEYLAAYYERRLEILEMTRSQLAVHADEMVAIGGVIESGRAVEWIERASRQVRSSIQIVDAIVGLLESRAMAAAKDQTLH